MTCRGPGTRREPRPQVGGWPRSGRVRRRCASRVDETPRGLTIVQCRKPWSEIIDPDWSQTPIARLSFSKQNGEWILYYADRNGRFKHYWECDSSRFVTDLLAEIEGSWP